MEYGDTPYVLRPMPEDYAQETWKVTGVGSDRDDFYLWGQALMNVTTIPEKWHGSFSDNKWNCWIDVGRHMD